MIAEESVKKLLTNQFLFTNTPTDRIYKVIEHELGLIVEKNCNRIIKAAGVSEETVKLAKLTKAFDRKQRKELAANIVKARNKLKSLNDDFSRLENKINALQKMQIRLVNLEIEMPPPPRYMASRLGALIPKISGVYFIYCGKVIVYVGQSKNLNSRLRLGNHGAILDDSLISFIKCQEKDLLFTEALYIGMIKPIKNFGKSSVHFQSSAEEKAQPAR